MRRLIIVLALLFVPGMAVADYKEVFEKEFMGKPWTGEVQEEESACIGCHAAQQLTRDVPVKWRLTVHYQNGVSCHNCHGGDPKDASLAMSHQRGFVGKPKPSEIPAFCGKCHIAILENYLESGHGKALKAGGKGPHCVTCHGSHKEQRYIQRANIEIINEGLCSRCHTYERARMMKQALSIVEQKIQKVDAELASLKSAGVYVEDDRKQLYSTEASFRALFHSIDVERIKSRSDEFMKQLGAVEERLRLRFAELRLRKNFSTLLFFVFASLTAVTYLLTKNPKE